MRLPLMRATIHLVSAADCLALRPLVQPVLDAELARHPQYAPALRDVDLAPVMAVARELLAERPRTGPQLRAALAAQFPGADGAALAFACRNRLALVQVPPRGLWGRSAAVTTTTAEAWLGRPLDPAPSLENAVVRYLAAFGPATVADVSAWCRLTALRDVVERLRPRLRTFRDERGRELFDLPDAPRPDADTPAPPRFLPEYDNALLSHADRSRLYIDRARLSAVSGPVQGTVLSDGFVCGVCHVEHARGGCVRDARRRARRAADEARGRCDRRRGRALPRIRRSRCFRAGRPVGLRDLSLPVEAWCDEFRARRDDDEVVLSRQLASGQRQGQTAHGWAAGWIPAGALESSRGVH